ncbi:MAG: hypothetical protein FWG66_01675 [Spirochaetes bacterium]|nr:hypothetical protein [Spirochaetota bacterium]
MTGGFAQIFDHIEQTRYLLYGIFESGLASARNVSPALGECGKTAGELGMPGGAKLLAALDAALREVAAGQAGIDRAALAYSNALWYYNTVADMLVVETMAARGQNNQTSQP